MPSSPVILLKSQLSHLGGLEKYTWQIARAFCQRETPVTVLTSGTVAAPFRDAGLHIVSFPIAHNLSFLNVRAFDKACAQYLREAPSPVVFGLDRNRFQTHLRAGNGTHRAYLQHRAQEEGWLKTASFRLNPLHRQLLNIEQHAFEHPELQVLFTNSHMVKQEILSHYQVDPQKIRVVHNGVEWSEMALDFAAWEEKRVKVAERLQLDLSRFQFLFIGHNYRRKGLDKLLRGLALLPDKQFQLSVVGKEKDLPFFQKLAERLGLGPEIVRFFGEQNPIRPFYQVADALVIPSLYDPFANVTVEALAMGLFVISSRSNGGHEVLCRENGVVIDNLSDPEEMKRALERARQTPKTAEGARKIRESVRRLDFSNQLELILQHCL